MGTGGSKECRTKGRNLVVQLGVCHGAGLDATILSSGVDVLVVP